MRRLWTAFQVGCVYVGTVVGAGFASGQEIYQFFGREGTWGYFVVPLAVVLFAWLGYRVMVLGQRLNARSFLEVNLHLFGTAVGTFVNGVVLFMLFGITVAMLAGAGELFRERAHIPFFVGVSTTAFFTFITILRGLSGVLRANSVIVPLMWGFVVVVFLKSLSSHNVVPLVQLPITHHAPLIAIVSAIIYSALNIGLAAGVLIPLGTEVKDERVLVHGATFGAVVLGLMICAILFTIRRHPETLFAQVPMASVAASFGSLFAWVFVFVLWGEIFSTLVGNVFAITTQIPVRISHFRNSCAAALLFGAALCSYIGFSNLVRYAYTAFGVVSVMLLAALLWPRFKLPDP